MEAATATAFGSEGVLAALRLAEQPEALLEQREALTEDCTLAVKQLFDLAKKLEPKTFTPLAELLVEGFTLDQIWEQIDLYNAPLLKYSQRGLKKHFAKPASVALPLPESESESDADGADESDGGAAQEADDPYSAFRDEGQLEDDELAGSSGDDSDPEAAAARVRQRLRAGAAGDAGGRGAAPDRRTRKKRHGMENSFFSFDDMEKFMDEAEEEYMNEYEKGDDEDEAHGDAAGWSYQEGDDDDAVPYKDEEGLFSEMQSDDEEASGSAIKYSDFFDPPDKLDGKDDVEIGFNPQFGPANKDESTGSQENGQDSAGSDQEPDEDEEGEDEEVDELEDEDEDEEEEEEEEEDEDGVGGFDSLRTEDMLQPDAGGGSGGANQEEEELDGELGPRSAFERAQAKLAKQIQQLEEQNVGQKRWETTGEVTAKTRPENSLLESVLDFQHAGKVKPVRGCALPTTF